MKKWPPTAVAVPLGQAVKSDTRSVKCLGALMASSAPNELALLLQRVVTTLPPETHPLVLSHLPVPELARLACVHKAFRVAWRSLQEQQPGGRYSLPSAEALHIGHLCGKRLVRAALFGDVAVLQSMFDAGVDEHGTQLLQARDALNHRVVDKALLAAAGYGKLQAAELLIKCSASVRFENDHPLRIASLRGHTAVVQLLLRHDAGVHADDNTPSALQLASENGYEDIVKLLLQHDADVHARDDRSLRFASMNGHAAVVKLLLSHGANVHAADNGALALASENGHEDIVQLLIQHDADVHADDDLPLRNASKEGHAAVVKLLLDHGANVHAADNGALALASENGHEDIVKLLIQHGALQPSDDEDEGDGDEDEME
jgi:ankyrin repeat protein